MSTLTATPQTSSELEALRAELQYSLDEVVAQSPEWESKLLNDYYYLQIAFHQNDLDKLRVFKKLAASFRTRLHLVEAVIDIIRDDLGCSEASTVISEAKVEAYRIVVEAFAGLGGIPEGAITRAAVRVVEAPEEAKSLAARIRDKKFI
jgi:hypothetical protein